MVVPLCSVVLPTCTEMKHWAGGVIRIEAASPPLERWVCRKSAGLVISRRKVTRSTSVECQLFFWGTPESLHRAAFANFVVAIREGCCILLCDAEASYGGDPKRMALVGQSAGAHLSSAPLGGYKL